MNCEVNNLYLNYFRSPDGDTRLFPLTDWSLHPTVALHPAIVNAIEKRKPNPVQIMSEK